MDTLYERIGSQKLRQVVDNFYDIVFVDSSISHLFDLENTQIRDKQYKFLTQFLGGPSLYSNEYGHPKMKLRHLPHQIGEAEKDEWLRCMKMAINKVGLENGLGEALFDCFPKVAEHMMNR
ncbi:MAG: globin [Crocinitomicaceae bacterium]|nr:globin [Crocinitomicaceae bacterium]